MKKISILTFKKNLFFLCYFLVLFNIMFSQVIFLSPFLKYLRIISTFLLLFLCLLNFFKMNKTDILIFVILIILSFVTKFVSGTSTILNLVLLIIAFKGIDLDKLIKFDIKIKILFLLIVSILYFLGYTNVNLHYRNGIVRHSMGLSNPNSFSSFIMSLVFEYTYLNRKKIRIKNLIFILLSILIIDYFSSSRTQIFCILLFFVLILVNKIGIIGKKHKISMFIIKNLFLILTIFSFTIVNLYKNGNETIKYINTKTSGRISSTSNLIDQYQINLIGNKVELVTSLEAKMSNKKQIALDNQYVYFILSYGLISYIIMYLCIRKTVSYAIYEENTFLLYIIIVLLIGGIMEKFCFEICFNIFLLYFSRVIYNKNAIDKKMEIGGI